MVRIRYRPQTTMSIIIKENQILAPRTTFKIGGVADFFASPKNNYELLDVLEWAYKKGEQTFF
ncbi:MAG: hypothetical protein ACRC5H_03415 [Treponemataceae bacterium]